MMHTQFDHTSDITNDPGKISVMMTVHRLSAGDGYAYYIRETVSADQSREAGQELGDYYTESGNPPGLWMGSGIELDRKSVV